MASKFYTEPIQIMQPTVTGDGQGGSVPSGAATVYRSLNAKIVSKLSRLSTEDRVSFTEVVTIEIAEHPSKPILENHYITWRGKDLSIDGIELTGNKKKVLIKCSYK